MRQGASHYDVLGVSPDAGAGEIRRAFRRLALRLHPDNYDGDPLEAERKFRRLTEAYRTLQLDRAARRPRRPWADRDRPVTPRDFAAAGFRQGRYTEPGTTRVSGLIRRRPGLWKRISSRNDVRILICLSVLAVLLTIPAAWAITALQARANSGRALGAADICLAVICCELLFLGIFVGGVLVLTRDYADQCARLD